MVELIRGHRDLPLKSRIRIIVKRKRDGRRATWHFEADCPVRFEVVEEPDEAAETSNNS